MLFASLARCLDMSEKQPGETTPLLLGGGRRLFERSADDVRLEMIETVATPQAVHIRYRVREKSLRANEPF